MACESLERLVREAEEKGRTLGGLMIEKEAALGERTREALQKEMKRRLGVMLESVGTGMDETLRSRGDMLCGAEAARLRDYAASGRTYCGETLLSAAASALAASVCNASMGRIVAAPTAGACGILPGVLSAARSRFGFSDDELTQALFCASAVGMVIAQKASVSGAQHGCQAECGAGTAMAAAAAVELNGGSPRQAQHAAALALKNLLGLVCDPVGGLVEVPCAKRNAVCAAIALCAADMALAGIESVIPADEVFDAMGRIGRLMPECLRETSLAGLALTPTAQEIAKKL